MVKDFHASIAASLALKWLKVGTEKPIEFDDVLRKVAAVSGATTEEMGALERKAMELGKSTKLSVVGAAQRILSMAMAGMDVDEIMVRLDVKKINREGMLWHRTLTNLWMSS